ncbi:MAG: hypothetical protein AAF799_39875 [Myxococcota bacterium]
MSHDFLSDLVQGERDSLAPPPGAKKKTWKQVTRSVAIGAPVSAWPTGKAVTSKLSLSWTKGLLAIVLGGTAVVGAWQLSGGGQATPATVVAEADTPAEAPAESKRKGSGHKAAASVPAVVEQTPAVETPEVEPPPLLHVQPPATLQTPSAAPKRRPSDTSPTAAPQPEAAPAAAASTLAEEARLLARARRELNGGNAQAALTPLAEHARRFPKGQLLEERLALTARASCRAGDRDRGRREAALLRKQFPASSQLARVANACDDT